MTPSLLLLSLWRTPRDQAPGQGHHLVDSALSRRCGKDRSRREVVRGSVNVTIIGENWKKVVQSLREESGKDIWLFGGGVPLVAEPATRMALTLTEHRIYERTGTVSLVYEVNNSRH